MKQLIQKGIQVDAIITDPPYGTTNHSWDKIIPIQEMWECLLKLIKPNGAIVLFGNEPFSTNLRKSNEKLYRYDWKWVKTQVTGFQNVKLQPLRCYEDIMVFSKAGIISNSINKMCYYPQDLVPVAIKKRLNSISYLGGKSTNSGKEYIQNFSIYPINVLVFPRETYLFHKTQKPIELMKYLVCTYTKSKELVLDFTSGSGSTLIACEKCDRRWIGIELLKSNCEIIKKRFKSGIQLELKLKKEDVR